MTLQESVALTYETNPSLLASRAELLASDENVSQANAAWRPTVTSSLSAGVSDTKTERQGITTTNATGYPRTGRLSITQPLFTGGENAAVIAGAEADVQAQRASLFNSEQRSEEHTSELHSLMRISYAVFCLKKKQTNHIKNT